MIKPTINNPLLFPQVLERYKLMFDDSPFILGLPSEEAIRLMQAAIDSGEPIPDPDVPEGAVI